MQILPSLASADQMHLGEAIRALKGCPCLHFDIEDGNFVPNITFGMKTIRAAARIWEGRMDAHLMVTNPADYLDFLSRGSHRVSPVSDSPYSSIGDEGRHCFKSAHLCQRDPSL